jgi:hypothetical protein
MDPFRSSGRVVGVSLLAPMPATLATCGRSAKLDYAERPVPERESRFHDWWRRRASYARYASYGGHGNRTRSRLFLEMAASGDFRGQLDQGQRVRFQLVVPVGPQESPQVLPSRGGIVESGGTGFPTLNIGRLRWSARRPLHRETKQTLLFTGRKRSDRLL